MMDAATVNSDAADFSIEVTDKRMAVRVNCLADETDLEPLAPRIVEKLVALAIADAPDADTVARLLSEQAAHGLHINGMILVQGQPPVAPVDGSIEWLGNFFDSGFQVDDETGAIDYRQHAAQVAVAKDQLLARLIAPCDGVEGHDVFGNRIPVAKAKAARLRIGANVRTDESGMEFYAAMDGRIR
jgi:uncharacterized protein (DUF342 family)